MGMISNLKVLIVFLFSSVSFLSNAFASGVCGSTVCAWDEICVIDKVFPYCAKDSSKAKSPITFQTNRQVPRPGNGKPPKQRSSPSPKGNPKNGASPVNKGSDNSGGNSNNSSDDEIIDYGGRCGENHWCRDGYYCDITTDTCQKGDANGNNSSAEMSACLQQYESLMKKCQTQISETSHSCDEKNDAGMNSTLDQAAQLTTALGQSTASSVQQSCSDSAALMQGANGALAAYSKVCSSSIEDCSTACSEVKRFAIENNSCMSLPGGSTAGETDLTTRAEDGIKQCKAFDAKVDQADQAISNFAKTLANAASCQQATSGDPNLGNGVQKLCASQPNYPGCNPAAPVDCSKPELATSNKVCICSKNPMDPACSGSQKVAGDNGLGPNLGSRLNSKSSADMFGGDLQDLPLPEHGNVNASTGKAIDGHQGGNAALGGGDSGAGGEPSDSGGSSTGGTGDQASGSGFYGSGGGIGNHGSGGGYNDGGSGGGRYASAAIPGKNNNPDLRKFLPGGQFDPRRGLAGMTGPDGITGPHTDIWRKVQNRYQVMQPSLLP